MTRPAKYGNEKTVVDGITFASKAEARRYGELKLLERGGVIRDLELQPEFKLFGLGQTLVCKYVADFGYTEQGMLIVEDVKGIRTAVYRLKAKLFRDNFGFSITEVAA